MPETRPHRRLSQLHQIFGFEFSCQFKQIAHDQRGLDLIFLRQSLGVVLDGLDAIQHIPKLSTDPVERIINAGIHVNQNGFFGHYLKGGFGAVFEFGVRIHKFTLLIYLTHGLEFAWFNGAGSKC